MFEAVLRHALVTVSHTVVLSQREHPRDTEECGNVPSGGRGG